MSVARQKKGLAVASLVLGVLSLPTLGLLGVGALASIVLGIVALVKAGNSPAEYGGKGLAIGGIACSVLSFLMIPVLGIVAAIVIPSLLRARIAANESASLGDVRTVLSAQTAYSSANGGLYDTLACLGAPTGCIPGYGGPAFLGPEMVFDRPRHGYRFTLHLGAPGASHGPVSPSSARSFAYVGVPVAAGQTGMRSFCGDSTGRVCATVDGEPEVVNGVCAPGCRDVR